jgi:RNA polymerase subunit RPABC4/transcription elongation factor Spt4
MAEGSSGCALGCRSRSLETSVAHLVGVAYRSAALSPRPNRLVRMPEPAWRSCDRCQSVVAAPWNVCPMCGSDHFIGRQPPSCSRCGCWLAEQWICCPQCGQDIERASA